MQFCGVQLCNDHPDKLTAVFLLKACSEPNQDLSFICTDPVIFGEEMLKLLSDKKYTSVPVMVSHHPLCEPSLKEVSLICYCMTAWLNGSTPFMGHNRRILMFIFAVNARCGTTNSV